MGKYLSTNEIAALFAGDNFSRMRDVRNLPGYTHFEYDLRLTAKQVAWIQRQFCYEANQRKDYTSLDHAGHELEGFIGEHYKWNITIFKNGSGMMHVSDLRKYEKLNGAA